MKISCEVIRDLLPLYAENVTSEESRKLVEEHVAGCIRCREQLEQIQKPVDIQMDTDTKEIVSFKKSWMKKTFRITGVAVLITAIVFAVVAFLYQLELPVNYEDVVIWTEDTMVGEAVGDGIECLGFNIKGDSIRLVYEPVTSVYEKNYIEDHYKVVRTTFIENIASRWFGERTQTVAIRKNWVETEDFKRDLVLEFADQTITYRNGVLME